MTSVQKSVQKNTRNIFHWDYIFGLGFFNLLLLIITFYIIWKCWLKNHIEDICMEYIFCGYADHVFGCLEAIGFFEANIRQQYKNKKEEEKLEPYFIGLNDQEKEVVKMEIKKNRVRLEEATRIQWEEVCKRAIRPDDEYHKSLLNIVVENEEVDTNVCITGTPRRRKIVRI
jgi:hypothetical protein